jgi:hypothetical protein
MPSKWDDLVREFDALTSSVVKTDPGSKKIDPERRDQILKQLKRLWLLLLEAWDRARGFWKLLDEEEREALSDFFRRLLRNPRLWTELSDEERRQLIRIVRKGLELDRR